MSLILVVESEGRHAERVRDGLGSDGWQVEVVSSCEAAVAAVADRAPQLVLINAELPGAPEMLRSLSRAHGGPGSIALLPEVVGRELGPLEADESLIKPFSEKDLRQLARRVVSSARAPRKSEDGSRPEAADFAGALRRPAGRSGDVRPTRPTPAPPPPTPPTATSDSTPGGDREIVGDGAAPRAHALGPDQGRADGGGGGGGEEGLDEDRRHAHAHSLRPRHAEEAGEAASGSDRSDRGGRPAVTGEHRAAAPARARPDRSGAASASRGTGACAGLRTHIPTAVGSRADRRRHRRHASRPGRLRVGAPAGLEAPRRPIAPPGEGARAVGADTPAEPRDRPRATRRARQAARQGERLDTAADRQGELRDPEDRRFSPPSCSRRRASSDSTRCSSASRSAAWRRSGRRA